MKLIVLSVFQGGLLNGGNAGLIYGYIFVWFGTILQVLVMAEMASMIPLAGGQYNWVAVLSPPSCSKFLSYTTGWLCVIGWQCTVASAGYLSGTLIQGLLVLNYPDYEFQRWHGTLLHIAVILVALFFNTITKPLLPIVELILLGLHVVGFFALIIPLVDLAPHASPKEVFATFYNGGDWSSDGLSFFVGLTATMFAFVGCDAATHLAEEIQHASTTIPHSMFASVALNGILGLGAVIAIAFCLGSDPSSILSTPTGYPVIQMFANATAPSPGSDLRAASAMSSVLILACVAATINVLASASRMLWAFARERGLPYSAWLSRVHSIPWGGHQLTRTAINSTGAGNNNNNNTLPLNALLVTAATASLLALINIGSAVAFNALTSLVVLASYATFAVPTAVLLLRRVRGRPTALAFGAFTLGRNAVAVPVVAAALAYSLLGAFFSLWPPTRRVGGPEELNWSGVMD
ncbi:putative amino acid transporter [Diplodia seriata]|uniref:Putative amino acid transporter n=1 Tax=Diplodia seriata TaxID=420778 RepID=A0A0G2EWZ7_9PEZI|nr:putative amino acid transporter [Diplodia seriata]